MNSIRFIFIILLVIVTLGMFNYTIFDKLNYIYLFLVLISTFIVLKFADKICLSYFNAKEITSIEDPELANCLKSLSYSYSVKEPKTYIYEGNYKSCFLLSSILNWNLLIEESLLLKLSEKQKYELVLGVIKIKKLNPNYLKTFGLSLQVISLSMLSVIKSKIILNNFLFFINPINKLIEKISKPKVNGKLDKCLQEFYFRNVETQKEFEALENILLKTPSKIEFQSYNILQDENIEYE